MLSFREAEFENIESLNIICGVNNSGKSNLIRIFEKFLKIDSTIEEELFYDKNTSLNGSVQFDFEVSDEIQRKYIELLETNFTPPPELMNLHIRFRRKPEVLLKFNDMVKKVYFVLKLKARSVIEFDFGFFDEQNQKIEIYMSNELREISIDTTQIEKKEKSLERFFNWALPSTNETFSYATLMGKNNLEILKPKYKTCWIFFNEFRKFLQNMIIIKDNRYFDPQGSANVTGDPLSSNGLNFPSWYHEQFSNYPEVPGQLNNRIVEYYPNLFKIIQKTDTNQITHPQLRQTGLMNNILMNYSSIGTQQLIIINARLLSIPENGMVLFDEPELHLHPQFQKILFNNLKKVANKIPIFIMTHSPCFIPLTREESVPITSLYHIRYLDNNSIVRNINVENVRKIYLELGIEPSDFLVYNGVILMEGKMDLEFFAAEFNFLFDNMIIKSIKGNGKEKVKSTLNLLSTDIFHLPGYHFVAILDKDEGNQKILSELDELARSHVKLLPVREIENLYMNPKLLSKELASISGKNIDINDINKMISRSITPKMKREKIIKMFLDKLPFRFSDEEIEEFINVSAESDIYKKFQEKTEEKYHCKLYDDHYIRLYEQSYQDYEIFGSEVWKEISGKQLRSELIKVIKSEYDIEFTFSKLHKKVMETDIVKEFIDEIQGFLQINDEYPTY